MKSFLLASIILFTSVAQASCPQFAYGGEFPKTVEQITILCKKEFAVGYSTNRKVPIFVLQKLDPEKLTSVNAIDSATFKIDPALPKELQAALTDYSNSGYDRGHQAPFEDNNHDATAGIESNYLTNVVPQQPGNNRGIWRILELNTRNAALDGTLYVITGTIFESNATIGANQVHVPTKLYKIIINPRTKETVTYIIPNISVSSDLLPTFISTRQMVKELAGIDPIPAITLSERTK